VDLEETSEGLTWPQVHDSSIPALVPYSAKQEGVRMSFRCPCSPGGGQEVQLLRLPCRESPQAWWLLSPRLPTLRPAFAGSWNVPHDHSLLQHSFHLFVFILSYKVQKKREHFSLTSHLSSLAQPRAPFYILMNIHSIVGFV
jgi:hypothetical protein